MPTLADIMRPELIEVAPEDTLGEVAERMTALNMGAAAVRTSVASSGSSPSVTS